MTQRPRTIALGRLAALGTLLSVSACSGEPGPNVVWIVVDTLRADHAGSDEGLAETPAFDALAEDGVAFPLAFSHAPVTLPSHAALFSSRTPSEANVLRNGQRVPGDLPLLHAWLGKKGYETHAVVSLATLWPTSRGRGLDRGFDGFERELAPIVRGATVHEHIEGALADVSDAEPFFLFVHYSDPHEPYDGAGFVASAVDIALNGVAVASVDSSPWTYGSFDVQLEPGENVLELESSQLFKVRTARAVAGASELALEWSEGELLKQTTRAVLRVRNPESQALAVGFELWVHDVPDPEQIPERYARDAERADHAVGRLIEALKRRGLYDGSVIVFTSDHGEALGERGMIGHARTLFDELLHVPLVIKPPLDSPQRGALEASRPHMARLVDVAPTVLDLLSLPKLPGQRGTSLLDARPRALLAETHAPDADESLYAVRDAFRKLVYHPASQRFELYDLVKDSDELVDIFAEQGGATREWQGILRRMAALADSTRAERTEEVDSLLRALGY